MLFLDLFPKACLETIIIRDRGNQRDNIYYSQTRFVVMGGAFLKGPVREEVGKKGVQGPHLKPLTIISTGQKSRLEGRCSAGNQ